MKKNSIFVKTLGFLMGGILIALVFTLTPGSHSAYTREYNGATTELKAKGVDDFIKAMEIIYDENGGPSLKLTRADNMDYSPVIFFSLEGDLKEYILHMDSVKLEKETLIPIIPNVNLGQSVSLVFSGGDKVKGKIRVKHLNEFINSDLDLEISKKYLLERYFLKTGPKNFKMASLSSKEGQEMEELVRKTISYTSPYMDWDKVLWEEEVGKTLANEARPLPISKAKMSSSQSEIIDLIAPDLLKYNEKLYALMEILLEDLNKYIKENDELKIEKEELTGEKDLLRKEKEELSDQVKDLEKTISELKDEGIKLKSKNEELYRQIAELRKNNSELYNEINALKADNENLYRQIESSKSKDDELYKRISYLEMDLEELNQVRREFGIHNGDLYNYIRHLNDKVMENTNAFLPNEGERNDEDLESLGD